MRIGIFGDSFSHTFANTWIQKIVDEFNFSCVSHIGLRGKSQYEILQEFYHHYTNCDIIMCLYTDHSRLYHPNYQITPNEIVTDNDEINLAANLYYKHLYQENFSKHIQNLLVKDIQDICKRNNILLINVPCFTSEHLIKFYGMWYCNSNGLLECSQQDYKKIYKKDWTTFIDHRLNHFSASGHEILHNDIKNHIKYYINNKYEYNYIPLYSNIFS